MLTNILVALSFILIGAGASWMLWRVLSPKQRALRLIDLVSYSLTIAAFGSAVFALKHYDDRWQAVFDRLEIRDAVVDADFDGTVAYIRACPDVRHTPLQLIGQKKAECDRLGELLRTVTAGTDIWHPHMLLVPDASKFTVSDVRAVVETVAIRINDYNRKLSLYETNAELGSIDTSEHEYLGIAIIVLGLAFGMGAARRALDLHRDWDDLARPASTAASFAGPSTPPALSPEVTVALTVPPTLPASPLSAGAGSPDTEASDRRPGRP